MDNKTKRRMEKDWSKQEDSIIRELANKYWNTKGEFLEEAAKQLPKVTPTQAMHHATKHLNLNIAVVKNTLEGEALTYAQKLLADGNDSSTVSNAIDLKYSVNLPNKYYNFLRFNLRRGNYVTIKDDRDKSVFEHRDNAAEEIKLRHKCDKNSARHKIQGKVVSHATTFTVSQNAFKDLFVTDWGKLYKIRMINMVTESLGLKFGTLLKNVDNADLEKFTPDKILKDMFEKSGLADEARKRYKPVN